MPTFSHLTPTQVADFSIHAAVNPDGLTVALSFSVRVLDANGAFVHAVGGDLSSFLTPQQVTNFTNATLALYTKAVNELLT